MKIGFIGIGNMGGAILRGILSSGTVSPENILICGRDPLKTEAQAGELGVTAAEHRKLVEECGCFFVGVEPGVYADVMPLIAEAYTPDKICISMAAGITFRKLQDWLGDDAKVIRIMPNTPARVGEIMTSVSPNENVTEEEAAMVCHLFDGMGKAETVPEDLISAVIGASGSSPAYTYMYIRGLAQSAQDAGMTEEKARVFAAQAVLGAAKIVLESDQTFDELIDAVCTPGGATYEAVTYLRENGMEELVARGAGAAIDKANQMSKE